MLQWVPDALIGGVPGRGTEEEHAELSLELEDAHLSPEGSEEAELAGGGGDVEKRFDTLPTEICHGTLRELGMDERVVRPLEGFYA